MGRSPFVQSGAVRVKGQSIADWQRMREAHRPEACPECQRTPPEQEEGILSLFDGAADE